MEKKLKIYLDTSVINFLFADDAPEKKEVTINFFENNLNDYDVYISSIVFDEIDNTRNEEKKLLLYQAIQDYKLLNFDIVNDNILEIANHYINEGIIPKNKFEDAVHIAFATYYEFDILLSWNFKHLSNVNKQRLINSVNLNIGYTKQLLLLNPYEVVYENED
ncbi:MAG: type II toxin-antitoxin system VapC family toxin [bacterium]